MYVLRESEADDRVRIVMRAGGYVYFRHESETSDKQDRLTEAEFNRRYVSEDEIRLQERG